MTNSTNVVQWLVDYFSHLTTEQPMACTQEMLRVNIRQNLRVVVQITTKYSDIPRRAKPIELFESFQSFECMVSCLLSEVLIHGIHRHLLLSWFCRRPQ